VDLTSDTPVGSSAPNSKLQEEGQKTENGPACVCRFICLCPQRHKHNSRLSTCRGSGGNRLVGRERRAVSRSTLHVADSANHRIRAIDDFDASPLVVTTVAGHRAAFGEVASSRDGIGAGASFNYPAGLCLDEGDGGEADEGPRLFVVDHFGHCVRVMSLPPRLTTT
jgi:hypothetical protein